MRIGFDIDGVLANFTDAYAELLTKETGIEFPLFSKEWPTVWYWDRAAGITKDVEKKVWGKITTSDFWGQLHAMDGALDVLSTLSDRKLAGDLVYFITSRPGRDAKSLTEYWLRMHGFDNPTVLIVDSDEAKGLLAKGLKLDVFVDDKPENCEHVVKATKILHEEEGIPLSYAEYPTRVFLVDAAYNRSFEMPGVTRVDSAQAALQLLEKSNVRVAA